MADVEGKLGFPMFQKYQEVFGVNLTEKTRKMERELILLSSSETKKIYEETECSTIEEYIMELGENSKEFSMVFIDLLGNNKKTREILMILKELWIEVNVLHKTAIFLR